MLHRQFDKLLIPYLEGSLDSHRREMLEEAIANDSCLAEEVEEMRRLKYQLQRSAANFSSASSNKSAWPGIQARIQTSRTPIFRTSSFWGFGLTMGAAAALVVCFGMPQIARLGGTNVASTNIGNSSLNPIQTAIKSPFFAPADASANIAESNLAPTQFDAFAAGGNHPDNATPAYISVPNVPAVTDQSQKAGNQVQQPDADMSHDSPIHLSLVSLAPYKMAFVEPNTESAPSPPIPVQNTPVAPAVKPSIVSAVSGSITLPSNAPATQAAPSQSTATLDDIAPASTIRLATMSTPTSTANAVNGDSPLIVQLRAVDTQAASDAASGAQSRALARWQSVLQATSSSAVFGDDSAQLLSMQSLEDIQAAGMLSAMRQELEQWQEQDPNNIGVRRMLAALYSVQGESSLALDQRRKAAALSTAIGEDWFQLGLSEEQAGNLNSANVDYNKALQCGDLSNAMHANFVRQRLPQSDS